MMDKAIAITLQSLRSRNLTGIFAESAEDAKNKILALIPANAVVERNDSTTVTQIGVIEALKKRGTKVLERGDDQVKRPISSDVFLTGTNAITQDGRLVDVDFVGNRIAGIVWGHPSTIIVVGRNKIVKNLEEAFYRVRNIIAPNHVRIRAVELGGRPRDTPCVVTGKCIDCRVRDRVCNVFVIIEGKPYRIELTVMLINEDFGLGWDEFWPKERIAKIIENYKKFVWVPSRPTN
ncbi:MAG: lactate utilization protein [Candidatus Bathyarchaeota archaeon]